MSHQRRVTVFAAFFFNTCNEQPALVTGCVSACLERFPTVRYNELVHRIQAIQQYHEAPSILRTGRKPKPVLSHQLQMIVKERKR